MRRSRIAGWLVMAALLCATCPAAPQPHQATPSAEDRKAARDRFAEGERAFKAGDFARAGEAFDDAYRLAPHPSAAWNAARAWQKAGEKARAANLYARYLREAPANDPDRSQSAAALVELS